MGTYNSSELDVRLQQAADALGVEFPSLPGGHTECVMWQQQLLIEELIRRDQAKTLELPALMLIEELIRRDQAKMLELPALKNQNQFVQMEPGSLAKIAKNQEAVMGKKSKGKGKGGKC